MLRDHREAVKDKRGIKLPTVQVDLPWEVLYDTIRGDKNKATPHVSVEEIFQKISVYLRDKYKEKVELTIGQISTLFKQAFDKLIELGRVKTKKSIVGRREVNYIVAVD